MTLRFERGLWLLRILWSKDGFLNIGNKTAVFSEGGTYPDSRDKFTIVQSVGRSMYKFPFNKTAGRGSRLQDLDTIVRTTFERSSIEIGEGAFNWQSSVNLSRLQKRSGISAASSLHLILIILFSMKVTKLLVLKNPHVPVYNPMILPNFVPRIFLNFYGKSSRNKVLFYPYKAFMILAWVPRTFSF